VSLTLLSSLPKVHRNQHVQACVRREIASRTERLQADVHYCYLCFNWVVGAEEWESHCQAHLQTLTSKRCGTITYCHTLVRPAYCPFCLAGMGKPAGERLQSWSRDHALWQHIESHIEGRAWPLACPHHASAPILRDDKELQFHLIDEHGCSRTRPKPRIKISASTADPANKRGSKRKVAGGGDELFWMPAEGFLPSNPAKRIRSDPSTIAPSLLSQPDDAVKCVSLHNDLALPSPAATTASSPPWDGGESPVDWFDLDHKSLTEISSRDNTLVDSPGYDDNLFSPFLRSPSPDRVSTSTDTSYAKQEAITPPDSGLTSREVDQDGTAWHDRGTDPSPEARNEIRIRLRVNPPKTTITLRCSAPQKKQQRAQRRPRKTKSAYRR
jgi:hypothetical protein